MGVYKELDIDYQQIVDKTADCLQQGMSNNPDAESQIWSQIGAIDYDLADQLTDVFYYEAALVCIERGEMPTDNPAWQTLVVKLAYNAIADADNFAYIIERSRFDQAEIQKMLDLAMCSILPPCYQTVTKHDSPNVAQSTTAVPSSYRWPTC